MVRLLIMAVFYIGDEAGQAEPADSTKRKTSGGGGGGGGGGLQQKKGKWKSVSRAMMEKGFYVSPQQCEDKFNDLNKRYKRVNDILGRGTACRVVENQSLLETMDLSPKLKEEVKKLLNSKHLFFREMCAYHNSCGHLTGNGNSNSNIGSTATADAVASDQTHQQRSATVAESAAWKMARIGEDETEEEEDDDDDDETTSSEEEENGAGVKRVREDAGRVAEDGSKSEREKREWMRRRAVELEEKRVEYEWEAVEMEKQRVKWMRFSSKKEKEMEKAMLENQRRRLQNQRMVLILRRKEMELLHHMNNNNNNQQQQIHSSGKRVDPVSLSG